MIVETKDSRMFREAYMSLLNAVFSHWAAPYAMLAAGDSLEIYARAEGERPLGELVARIPIGPLMERYWPDPEHPPTGEGAFQGIVWDWLTDVASGRNGSLPGVKELPSDLLEQLRGTRVDIPG